MAPVVSKICALVGERKCFVEYGNDHAYVFIGQPRTTDNDLILTLHCPRRVYATFTYSNRSINIIGYEPQFSGFQASDGRVRQFNLTNVPLMAAFAPKEIHQQQNGVLQVDIYSEELVSVPCTAAAHGCSHHFPQRTATDGGGRKNAATSTTFVPPGLASALVHEDDEADGDDGSDQADGGSADATKVVAYSNNQPSRLQYNTITAKKGRHLQTIFVQFVCGDEPPPSTLTVY